MPYSNCCHAFTNMEELGICPDCKDHCDFEEECDRCEGYGFLLSFEIDKNSLNNNSSSPTIVCNVCNGTGIKQLNK
jgi:RecJ-like exonuclease